MQPIIEITSTQRTVRVPRAKIEQLIDLVTRREGVALEQIDLAVVGKARMATLNERHLRHAGPTDVLSFDLGPGPRGGLCAQIVVCSDVALRQARRRGHAAWKELLLYVLHGLLHAIGYDDQAAAEAEAMHAREDELLSEIGVGAIYASGR